MVKIKNILISQPEPVSIEKSPFKNLVEKFNLNLTFYKFFDVVGVEAKEFRKERIYLLNYTAVIFNSKNSVDHYFRLAKELREEIPDTMKYFCASEAIALYLQNYVQYRKRKIFFGKQTFADLIDVMHKHKDEHFLFPCSDEAQPESFKLLDKSKYKYTKACMYKSLPRDLSHLKIDGFDMIVVFSPVGVKSLCQNFPDIKSKNKIIAAFGQSTQAALIENGLNINIVAPTKSAPSMAMAIEDYMLGKEPEPLLVSKPATLKKSTPKKAPATKKAKSVFTNKSKYVALLESKRTLAAEKKAEVARRKAEAEAKKNNPTE